MKEQDLINSINQQLPDNQQRRIKAENTRIVLGNFLAYTKDNFATKEELSEYGSSAIVGIYDDTKLPTDYPLFDANKVNRFIVNTEGIGPFISPAAWGSITVNFSDIENNEVFFIYESDGSWKKYVKRVKGDPGADGDDGANGTATYNDWQPTSYLQDAQVFHEGTIYEVTDPSGATASDIPGDSPKWAIKVMGDLPQSKVLPVPDFIADHDFVFPGGAVASDSIYYDPLNKVVKGDKIKAVSIYIETNYQNGGTIQIVALDMNENVIDTHTASGLVEGVNTVNWSASFDQDVYIGIKSTDSRLAQDLTLYPGFTYPTRYTLNNGVSWINGVYPLGIEVHVDDYSQTAKGMATAALDMITTKDDTELQNKLAAGGLVILDAGKEYIVNSTIIPKPGTRIIGNGAILKFGTGVTKIFDINGIDDIFIRDVAFIGSETLYASAGAPNYGVAGPAEIPDDVKNMIGIGSEIAIELNDVKRINIFNCRFLQITGHGIKATSFNKGYTDGVKIKDNYFFNNFNGIHFSSEAEYSQISGNTISYNQIGIYDTSGNNTFIGNNVDGNRCNIFLGAGTNDAHGSLVGGTVNHASKWGILTMDVANGFAFSGFQTWFAPIRIIRSKGVIVSGSFIASKMEFEGNNASPGRNYVHGCIFNADVEENYNGQTSHVVLRNNISKEGSRSTINNNLD